MQNLQALIMGLRVASIVDPAEVAAADEAAREEWAYSTGIQIWIYGFPMMRVEQFRRLLSGLDAPVESLPYAPPNRLGHMRLLPTHESQMPFTPNVDTLYSGAIGARF